MFSPLSTGPLAWATNDKFMNSQKLTTQKFTPMRHNVHIMYVSLPNNGLIHNLNKMQ